jgi:phage terminase large subunit-like protein
MSKRANKAVKVKTAPKRTDLVAKPVKTAGSVPVWTTACPDWERRIVAQESLIPFGPLFPDAANQGLAYFNDLRVADVAPRAGGDVDPVTGLILPPKMGELAKPWLTDFVSAIFGSYDESIGKRWITEYFLLISKKNTKSTTAAGIMLTALLLNWRPSAEFIILAPTKEVANNAFFPARDMVKNDAELGSLLHVQPLLRSITHRITNATLKVLSASDEVVGGKKASGILVDELWLFGKRENADAMLLEATGGLASRDEGFVIYLSTQSDEPPAGVFKNKLAYARDVRDGKVNDKKFLPVIYEFPEKMLKSEAYKDTKYFYVTNPNLGASVSLEYLEREYKKAQPDNQKLRNFLAKHLNVEIGMRLRSAAWEGAKHYMQSTDTEINLDYIVENCEQIIVGIDGGGLADLLGMAVVGHDGERWVGWCKAWCHKSAIEYATENYGQAGAVEMLELEKDGDLVIVEHVGDDVDQLADIVERLNDTGNLTAIGLDPHAIGAIVDAVTGRGIEKEKILGVSQGWRLTSAIKTTARKMVEGSLKLAKQPLMQWAMSNARVEARGNAVLITKAASGSMKIDPLMALLDAVEIMSRNPAASDSKYQVFFVGGAQQ